MTCFIGFISAALLFLGGLHVFGSDRAEITVTARVLAYCQATIEPRQIEIHVNAKDIRLGYIELLDVAETAIKTNNTIGADFAFGSWAGGEIFARLSGYSGYLNKLNLEGCNEFGVWCPKSALDLRLMTRNIKEPGVYHLSLIPEWTNCNF